MKKLFFIIPILLLSNIAFAQNTVYYYDNAGNRIQKVIVMQATQAQDPESISQEKLSESSFQEMLAEYTVKIYPNPTKGQLSVEITGVSSDVDGQISLLNMNGKMILTQTVHSGLIDLNLSNYNKGIYLLKIVLGEQATTWKIIKE